MKYLKRQEGMVLPLVVGLVAVVIVVVGVAVWQLQKAKASPVASSSPTPTTVVQASSTPTASLAPTATPAPSDSSLIVSAMKSDISSRGSSPSAGTQLILRKLEGNYARVDVNPPHGGGYFELLKRNSSGTWSVSFWGQNISPSQEVSLGFPSGFSNSVDTSQVVFTY